MSVSTGRAAQNRRSRRRIIIASVALAAIAGVALFAVIAVAGHFSLTSRMCGSCHIMKAYVQTWDASPHAKVGCYACHDRRYGYLLGRESMLRRWVYYETTEHSTLTPKSVATTDVAMVASTNTTGPSITSTVTSAETTPPFTAMVIRDATCERCHTLRRTPSSQKRITVDHAEHARRNRDCMSCHGGSAHASTATGGELGMMLQCAECHKLTNKKPDPVGECTLCHPPNFEGLPKTHEPATWKTAHGKESLVDRELCRMCHRDGECTDCHGGLKMPHPDEFVQGDHGARIVAEPVVCSRCHENTQDFCEECHHGRRLGMPGRVPKDWVKEHQIVLRQVYVRTCLACHEPKYCVRCHSKPKAR